MTIFNGMIAVHFKRQQQIGQYHDAGRDRQVKIHYIDDKHLGYCDCIDAWVVAMEVGIQWRPELRGAIEKIKAGEKLEFSEVRTRKRVQEPASPNPPGHRRLLLEDPPADQQPRQRRRIHVD